MDNYKGKYPVLPPLTPAARETLKESIRQHGVLTQVVVDEDGNILDGHYRVKACRELGIDCPKKIITGLSETEKIVFRLELNLKRRPLGSNLKKKDVATFLSSQGWSNAAIGELLSVNRATVWRWILGNVADATTTSETQEPHGQELHEELEYYCKLTVTQKRRIVELRDKLDKIAPTLSSVVALVDGWEAEYGKDTGSEEIGDMLATIREMLISLNPTPEGGDADTIDHVKKQEMPLAV